MGGRHGSEPTLSLHHQRLQQSISADTSREMNSNRTHRQRCQSAEVLLRIYIVPLRNQRSLRRLDTFARQRRVRRITAPTPPHRQACPFSGRIPPASWPVIARSTPPCAICAPRTALSLPSRKVRHSVGTRNGDHTNPVVIKMTTPAKSQLKPKCYRQIAADRLGESVSQRRHRRRTGIAPASWR